MKRPLIIFKHNGKWMHQNRGGISPDRAIRTVLAFAFPNYQIKPGVKRGQKL
jgi:hypothetical protein